MIEAKIARVVKAGDSWATNIAKAELAFLQNKKYQSLVVWARLKRISCEATNIAQELRAEELRHATDRHITSVTSPNEQRRTTNEAICKEFWDYFKKLFTRESKLSSIPILPTFLASLGFSERWVTIACMCRVIGASLIFNLDIARF